MTRAVFFMTNKFLMSLVLLLSPPLAFAAGDASGQVQVQPKAVSLSKGNNKNNVPVLDASNAGSAAHDLQDEKVQRLKRQILMGMKRDDELNKLAPYLGPGY